MYNINTTSRSDIKLAQEAIQYYFGGTVKQAKQIYKELKKSNRVEIIENCIEFYKDSAKDAFYFD